MTNKVFNVVLIFLVIGFIILIGILVVIRSEERNKDKNKTNGSDGVQIHEQISSSSISSTEIIPQQPAYLTYKFVSYPVSFQYSADLLVADLNEAPRDGVKLTKSNARIQIVANQPGLGFSDDTEMTEEPLIVDGNEISINGNKVTKMKLVSKSTGSLGYLFIIHYPTEQNRQYSVMITYHDLESEHDPAIAVFDRIVSTIKIG